MDWDKNKDNTKCIKMCTILTPNGFIKILTLFFYHYEQLRYTPPATLYRKEYQHIKYKKNHLSEIKQFKSKSTFNPSGVRTIASKIKNKTLFS